MYLYSCHYIHIKMLNIQYCQSIIYKCCFTDMVHYEVVLQEAINGESPAVGIATCSPLKPTPTCVLLRDYFRWKADGKGEFRLV